MRPEVLTGQGGKAIEALGLEGFDGRLPTVYVPGGAQGSQQINHLVRDVLPWLVDNANVIHQCGPGNVAELRQATAHLPAAVAGRYHLSGYMGAELPPLASSAGNEQVHNARHLADQGAAVALVGDVSAERLREVVAPLLTDAGLRSVMAQRARSLGRPDAGERLIDVVLDAARAERGGRGFGQGRWCAAAALMRSAHARKASLPRLQGSGTSRSPR